jgi:hypothetical protein
MLILAFVFLAGCEKDIIVQCHSDCTNLKFEDEDIGVMLSGEERTVPVKSLGTTTVTWTNYDNGSESDEISGVDAEDGKVWHLYYGYGSWEEW